MLSFTDMFAGKRLFLKCARGIAPYLRREAEGLGYKVTFECDTGIEVEADFTGAQELNLNLRTCQHVVALIKKFSCASAEELYDQINTLAWEELIDPKEYLSVVSVTDTESINNSMFASQKVKDAICDRLMQKCGSRPDSGSKRDNIVVNIYWKNKECWLYLDTSGNKLSDRGYRMFTHSAPMQECLAAATILASGYDGTKPFVNPMCGSGTLAIEAAWIALNRAPGLLRDNFGFMHIKNFDNARWQTLRKDALSKCKKSLPRKIIATDNDPRAIEAAKKNAKIAGVLDMIEFRICPFEETPIPQEPGIVMLNPEYGVRLGEERELGPVYKGIGDFFKQKCQGYMGYIFTGNANLAKQVGLRTKRKMIFFNAQIECRLLEYELYSGSKREDYGKKI